MFACRTGPTRFASLKVFSTTGCRAITRKNTADEPSPNDLEQKEPQEIPKFDTIEKLVTKLG